MKYLLLALSVFLAPNAEATITHGEFRVGASILTSCTASSTTLNFGMGIDPLHTSGAVDATADLSVICTNSTPYSIGLSAGSSGTRTMKNGNSALPYQLYLDAARSKIWGEDGYRGVGTGSTQSLAIYGRLPSMVGAVPGTYSDTVSLTITY